MQQRLLKEGVLGMFILNQLIEEVFGVIT